VPKNIIDYVAEYYSTKVETHGATPQGVDWNGSESQDLRFQQLLKVCAEISTPFSVLDYGCGYGAMFDYMSTRFGDFSYVGYDCSAAMIEKAQQLHQQSNCTFSASESGLRPLDFTIASGIFNVRGDYTDADWHDHCIKTIRQISALSNRGFAFNMLTKYSDADKMRDYLYYSDPCEIFDFCKRELGRNVALLHDYGLYEFTILVRK
jgi:SAM-dependent methyltransferase